VVKSYAPAGLTPVIYEWQSRDHLSIMGGLTPQGKMYSLVRQEALNGLHSVAFLGHLLRLAGERLLVIGDSSPIHRRAEVKEFLASPTPTVVEPLVCHECVKMALAIWDAMLYER
jgi:DDE superfamily endonuclease